MTNEELDLAAIEMEIIDPDGDMGAARSATMTANELAADQHERAMAIISILQTRVRTAEAERDNAARHAREVAITDALTHLERHWLGTLDGALAALRALAPEALANHVEQETR